ncbi:hypothetical protein GCM10022278_36640 [Allohahella marinimesophila]|uniref:Uncharacterized protein n=1 Tax=Allohahella marinimesophila TaxID=1054972 RepID=A0ABP7Q5T4_9GAMM
MQRDALSLDGNAALAFDVHRIKHLGLHFARLKASAVLDEAVCNGGLAVIDVCDDRKISDGIEFLHIAGPEKKARNHNKTTGF